MGFSVELYFDKAGEKAVRDLWQKISDADISSLLLDLNGRPHLSMAVYHENADGEAMLKALKGFRLKGFKVRLVTAGLFCSNEGAVFVAPKVTRELLDAHEALHRRLKRFQKSEWEAYRPENWIPHCTMGNELDTAQIMETIKLLKERFRPLEVRLNEIGLVRFRPVECVWSRRI